MAGTALLLLATACGESSKTPAPPEPQGLDAVRSRVCGCEATPDDRAACEGFVAQLELTPEDEAALAAASAGDPGGVAAFQGCSDTAVAAAATCSNALDGCERAAVDACLSGLLSDIEQCLTTLGAL